MVNFFKRLGEKPESDEFASKVVERKGGEFDLVCGEFDLACGEFDLVCGEK